MSTDQLAILPDDDPLRLGKVLSELQVATAAIRRAMQVASPPGPMRQPLDLEEHDGHWLTRPQIKTLGDAAMDIEAILRRLQVRMDPRCKATLGERPGWMSPDQYEACRCTLPRDHEGEHACEHVPAGGD